MRGAVARPVDMSNHKNDLMDLHYAVVVGALLGARPQQTVAAHDAEPEVQRAAPSASRRLAAAVRARRSGAARPETGRV